jgi:hypothetical protein
MLNLNLNIIECQRRAIAPITITNFDYLLIGGGGGGAAGQGAIGGNGGAGGSIISGSFDVSHFAGKIDLLVGAGGVGGTGIGLNGTNGASSSLFYNDSLIQIAAGGAAGVNSTENRGGKTSTYDSIPTGGGDYLWVQDGTKGGDSPVGSNGVGGGQGNQIFPWGTSPTLTTSNGFTNSGGGGGGLRWDEFNPGGGSSTAMGAAGMCMLRLFDPRDVFTYTGDWEVFVYQNGYKYFYYQTDGTFSFFGKRD